MFAPHSAPRRRFRFVAAVGIAALAVGLLAAPAQAVENLDTIDLAPNNHPRGMAITPDGALLFVPNEGSDTVSVIDTVTNTSIGTITVSDGPIDVAVSPNGSIAYVVAGGADVIDVIDVNTLAVVGTPITVTDTFPASVVFSPNGATAYVAGYGTGVVNIINVGTAMETDVVSGFGAPQGLAVTSDGGTLWVSGNGSLRSMDTTTLTISGPLQAPGTPQIRFLGLSPDESTIVMGGDGTTDIYFVDTATSTIVDTVDVGQGAYAFGFSGDGSRLYVGLGSNDIAEIDLSSHVNLGNIATGAGSWSIVMAPSGDFGYVSNYFDNNVAIVGDPVRRISGAGRYETAIAVSQSAFPAGAGIVLVATGLNYPDALAAGPAAGNLNAPLLLTDPNALPQAVRDEIVRLNPARIIVVGGEAAVSAAVYNALELLPGTIERIQGADRFDTSRKITEEAFGPGGATSVFIATGSNFPDALSAGAVGAAFGSPVLLVNGAASSVDQATLDTLSYLGATATIIAGGTSVVSSAIEAQLALEGFPAARLAGANRYDTSLKIGDTAYPDPDSVERVLIATGTNFPDALAGSAWAGKIKAPLFIVPGTCIPQAIYDKIVDLGALQVTLIGGSSVLTQSVFDLTVC